MSGVGIPIKLLHESEGHVVTVELKTGTDMCSGIASGMIAPNVFYRLKLVNLHSVVYVDGTAMDCLTNKVKCTAAS